MNSRALLWIAVVLPLAACDDHSMTQQKRYVTYAPADLFPERTPGGGLILSAVKDHIDPTNPDHVLASQKLQTILSERAGKASQRGDIHPGRFPPRVGPC